MIFPTKNIHFIHQTLAPLPHSLQIQQTQKWEVVTLVKYPKQIIPLIHQLLKLTPTTPSPNT